MDFTKANKAKLDEHIKRKSDINDKLEDFFKSERDVYAKDYTTLIAHLKSNVIANVVGMQADILSLKQVIVDKTKEHIDRLIRENVKLKKAKADRHEFYMTGFGLKTGVSEKAIFLDRDLAEDERGVRLLETHVEYLRDLTKSCENINYAIKNRIELMQYM